MFSFSHGVHVCFQADKLRAETDSVDAQRLLDAGPIYYTRTRGLFRECFLGQKEPGTNQPIPKPDGVGKLTRGNKNRGRFTF